MTKDEILNAFEVLNSKLSEKDIVGEIGIVGGAAMILAYGSNRSATKDVDAIFEPSKLIRDTAKLISKGLKLPEYWLNDAVKGFMRSEPKKMVFLDLSHLKIWVPEAEYVLAMKSISARFDSADAEDIKFLCDKLNFKKPDEVFELVEKYYPRNQIPPKTIFFIEEIFENKVKTTKKTKK